MRTRHDLRAFVLALPVPPLRRAILLVELEDHVFEAMAELEARGLSPAESERAAVAALGSPAMLHVRLLASERSFGFPLGEAVARGLTAGVLCSILAVAASVVAADPGMAASPQRAMLWCALLTFVVMWTVALTFPGRLGARERTGGRRNVAIYSVLVCGLPVIPVIAGTLVANDGLVLAGWLGWSFVVMTFVSAVTVDAFAQTERGRRWLEVDGR